MTMAEEKRGGQTRRLLPLLRFPLLLLMVAALCAALPRSEGSASGSGWAYRYGRWTEGLDPLPGLKPEWPQGVVDPGTLSIAPTGSGVILAGQAPQFCDRAPTPYRGLWCTNAGVLMGIGSDGQLQWLKGYNSDRDRQCANQDCTSRYSDDAGFNLVTPLGNTFLVGGFTRFYGPFIAAMDGSGNALWARTIAGRRAGSAPCGNVTDAEELGGGIVLLTEGHCIFRLDGTGIILWAKVLDSRLWASDILPWGSDILVAGTYAPSLFCGSSSHCYGFVGLLKGDGSGFRWLRYYHPSDPNPNASMEWSSIRKLLPGPDGNIAGLSIDGFVKISPLDGRVLRWTGIDAVTAGANAFPDVIAASGSGFVVAGDYYQPSGAFPCGNDIFVATLDSDGNVQQSKVLGGDGCDSRAQLAVAADGIYVATHDGGLPVVMKLGTDLSVDGLVHPGSVYASQFSDPFPNDDQEMTQSQLLLGLGNVSSPSSQPFNLVATNVSARQAPWYHRFLDVAVDDKARANVRVTSSPQGIDCGSDCWEEYPHGTSVTVTLQELGPWPPTVLYCNGQRAGLQATVSLTQPDWFRNDPSGDAVCNVSLDSGAVNTSLSASPGSLTMRQLEGSDRPQVTFTFTLKSRGNPAPGQAVEVAIVRVSGRCRDNPQNLCSVQPDQLAQVAPLALEQPQQTGQDGTYTFHWVPPAASTLQQMLQPPVSVQFAACAAPWTIQDYLNYYWLGCASTSVNITPSVTVKGRVLQRHAGALADPDGDGISPVPFVDVSTDPTFPPDKTVLTGDDGSFSLPDVPCNQDVTIYVSQLVPGEQYRVYTQSMWSGYLQCPLQGNETTIDDIYVAYLAVTRQMLQTWLPDLAQKLGQSSPGVAAHRAFIQDLRSRIAPGSDFGPTQPWEEEALRRLSLSERIAKDGLDTMFIMGECGVRYLWDSSLAILVGLFNKMVDTYGQALFQKANIIRTLRETGNTQELQKELARLNAVEKAIVDALVKWQEQLRAILRGPINSFASNLDELLTTVPVSGSKPLLGVDAARHNALLLLLQTLSDYDLAKAFYDWAKGVDQAASELTDWPGVVATISSLRDQLISPITNLLDQLHAKADDLAKGAIRGAVDGWLHMAAGWAANHDFVQGPDSYRQAAERAAAYADRLSHLWGDWSSLCTNMENFYNIVYESSGALQLAATLASLVTGGTTAALSGFLEAVQWGTLAAKAATGLVFIGMAQPFGEAGQLTRLGIYDTFDKAAVVQQEQEDLARALSAVVFSPAHIMAVDRLGRRVGIGADGIGLSEVPGAVYLPAAQLPMPDDEQGQTVSPHETLVLPLEHAPYTLLIWGTGDGPYTIKVMAVGTEGLQELGSISGTARTGSLQVATLAEVGGAVRLGQPQDFSQDQVAGIAVYGPDGRVDGPLSLTAGQSIALRAYLERQDGATAPPVQVSWGSSAPETASIEPLPDGTAIVRAGRAGQATITVQAGGRTATVQVDVTAGPPAQVQLEVSGQAPVTAGGQACVRARVLDAGGNPVASAAVNFLAFGSGTALAQGTSGQDGWTQAACFAVPQTAGGPEVVQGVVQQGDQVMAVGRTTLMVVPVIEGSEGWPERAGGEVQIRSGDQVVGSIQVPAGAFPNAVVPMVNGTVLGEDVQLPALPSGTDALLRVAVNALDLASASPLAPAQSLRLTLLGQGQGMRLLRLAGNSWQEMDASPAAGGLSAGIDGPGIFALVASTGTGGGGGGSSGGSGGGSPPPPPPPPPPPTAVTVPSPTGTGDLTFQVASGATPASFQVQPFTGTPPVPVPQGYSLPHGLYSLTAAGLPPGTGITVQVTLPAPAPVGTVWLKLMGGSWVALPVGDDDGDNVITITLTDGDQVDADDAQNGVIADPGGPAIPQQQPTPTPTPAPPSAPPAAPGLVSLWPCGEGVACISFLPSQGATSYRLESALEPGFSFGLNSVEVDASSLLWGNTIVVGMPTGDMWAFYYRLSACNEAGCSGAVFVGGMAARRFPAGTTEHWALVVGGYRFLGVSYGWAQSQVSVPGKASELHLYDGVQGYGGRRVYTCSGVQPGGSCSWQWPSSDPWLSGSQEFPPYGEVGVAVRLSP
ncbi:hypothetical protein HRbin24_00131 [bacterium HR24]|nr:hypothetical protein HRbin24_00131 [bacterium HR24]